MLVGSRGNLSLQIFITATTAVTRPPSSSLRRGDRCPQYIRRREREGGWRGRGLFLLGPTATLRYYNRYGEDSGSGLEFSLLLSPPSPPPPSIYNTVPQGIRPCPLLPWERVNLSLAAQIEFLRNWDDSLGLDSIPIFFYYFYGIFKQGGGL